MSKDTNKTKEEVYVYLGQELSRQRKWQGCEIGLSLESSPGMARRPVCLEQLTAGGNHNGHCHRNIWGVKVEGRRWWQIFIGLCSLLKGLIFILSEMDWPLEDFAWNVDVI